MDGPGSSGSSWTKADMVGDDPGRLCPLPHRHVDIHSGEAENLIARREEKETRPAVCGQSNHFCPRCHLCLYFCFAVVSPLFSFHLAPADEDI